MTSEQEIRQQIIKDLISEKVSGTSIGRITREIRQQVAKEILNRIEAYFVDTVEPGGVLIHHIDDTEWHSKIKSRYEVK